jgi:flavin reductase (DIM6/NTAB) family NADH-FMN oxidoreductase RutF
MYLDLTQTPDWRSSYQLLISVVNPRPIALVSTVTPEGHHNLAPFSFFNLVSGNPPVAMFCPSLRRNGHEKDTLRAARATHEFVIAVVTEAIIDQAVACGADLAPGQSEFDFSGLTATPARRVKPALVAESPVNLECTLRQVISLGDAPGAGRVVLGDIVAVHVADWLLDSAGHIDPLKLRTVGRLGGKWYATVTDPYQLTIPAPPAQ